MKKYLVLALVLLSPVGCKSKQASALDSFKALAGQVEVRLKEKGGDFIPLPDPGMSYDVTSTDSVVSPFRGELRFQTAVSTESQGERFVVTLAHLVTYANQDGKWVLKAHSATGLNVTDSETSLPFVRQEIVGKKFDFPVNDGGEWSSLLGGS